MIYLKHFTLQSAKAENDIAQDTSVFRIDNSMYPLHIFPMKGLQELFLGDITIIHGGNGSGKSTLLNIIAEKLKAERRTPIDKGSLFDQYVNMCKFDMERKNPLEVKIISSDDVFSELLDARDFNFHLNNKKKRIGEDYISLKYSGKIDDDIFDYQKMRDINDSLHKTESKYVRGRLSTQNVQEHSNGETALLFWEREIKENSIYILDEPENSLSAENQMKLRNFIEESVRFYGCQFIISTHSPFLLSLMDATIYDLDADPCRVRPWTDLPNVKIYYDFFRDHKAEFDA